MSAVGRMSSLTGSTAASYGRSVLHASTRAYAESNCYTDVVIELVHARGLEPLAMLGHVLRTDFEGDQFTFFKPPPADLEELFGIDVHEMQPYRPLPDQIADQLGRDRTLIVELDSFHLPDTAGTSYRSAHVKSSVAADGIDPEGERLRYFHGPALWELEDEDYRGVFRIADDDPIRLPPYTELVRFDAGAPLAGDALRSAARRILSGHLRRRPADNPFLAFGDHLAAAQGDLLADTLERYHAYAFATVRLAGSAFELLGDHVRWLFDDGDAAGASAAAAEIVEGCKALSFRMARRRPFDATERIEALAASWQRVVDDLIARAD